MLREVGIRERQHANVCPHVWATVRSSPTRRITPAAERRPANKRRYPEDSGEY
jgi:hypothetical protein